MMVDLFDHLHPVSEFVSISLLSSFFPHKNKKKNYSQIFYFHNLNLHISPQKKITKCNHAIFEGTEFV